MSSKLQPLLADNKVKIDATVLPQLRYPIYASPKLDGLRCRIFNRRGMSRSHISIPNVHLQYVIHDNPWMEFFDGELIFGEPTAEGVFNRTQSAFMSEGGTPTVNFFVFDHFEFPDEPYDSRLDYLQKITNIYTFNGTYETDGVTVVPQALCHTPDEVILAEAAAVAEGYEGLILRDPHGKYKNGRSTFKEGILLKFKRLQDAEAKIVGFEPLMRNNNEQIRDVFGYARRSSHIANKQADSMLGALVVEAEPWGQFTIGSGFDDSQRFEIWARREQYLGKTVSFKYHPYGTKDSPRFPIFKGIRHD